jgi:hypothetical protein
MPCRFIRDSRPIRGSRFIAGLYREPVPKPGKPVGRKGL